MIRAALLLSSLMFLVFASMTASAWAKTETVEATYTYVMGDNDSKSEARRLCYLEAKRKLLEKAGTYMEVFSKTEDFRLTRDEIVSFSGAVLKVRVVKEEPKMVGGNFAITMTVRAEVDDESMRKALERFAADPQARAGLRRSAEKERGVENELLRTGAPGEVAAKDWEATLRDKTRRLRSLEKLEDLEQEKADILAGIEQSSQRAATLPTKGMTTDEVIRLLGQPRALKGDSGSSSGYVCGNYGQTWVVFKDGLVECVRSRLQYRQNLQSDCHCAGFAGTFIVR